MHSCKFPHAVSSCKLSAQIKSRTANKWNLTSSILMWHFPVCSGFFQIWNVLVGSSLENSLKENWQQLKKISKTSSSSENRNDKFITKNYHKERNISKDDLVGKTLKRAHLNWEPHHCNCNDTTLAISNDMRIIYVNKIENSL